MEENVVRVLDNGHFLLHGCSAPYLHVPVQILSGILAKLHQFLSRNVSLFLVFASGEVNLQ